MARLLLCLLGTAVLQAAAFVAPEGGVNPPDMRAAGKAAPLPMEPAQASTSSPFAVIALSSMLGLVLGLATAQPAMAQMVKPPNWSPDPAFQRFIDVFDKKGERVHEEIMKEVRAQGVKPK
mmetsp:Transcript_58250/g.109039  ORF Transcript_58250/g.109039 Transcript_58250/m.109039 type:complete len:121 (+) Transcript_58250:47-409(+)